MKAFALLAVAAAALVAWALTGACTPSAAPAAKDAGHCTVIVVAGVDAGSSNPGF